MYTVDDLIDRIEKRIQIDTEIYLLEGVDFSYTIAAIRSLFGGYILNKMPDISPDEDGVITLMWTHNLDNNVDVVISVSKEDGDNKDTLIAIRYEKANKFWLDTNSKHGLPNEAIQVLSLKRE